PEPRPVGREFDVVRRRLVGRGRVQPPRAVAREDPVELVGDDEGAGAVLERLQPRGETLDPRVLGWLFRRWAARRGPPAPGRSRRVRALRAERHDRILDRIDAGEELELGGVIAG